VAGRTSAGAAELFTATLAQFSESLEPPWQIVDWSSGSIAWRLFRLGDLPLPQQGWKIHVSCAAVEAPCLMSTVAPLLVACGASFKIARTAGDIVHINSGDAGAVQVGKVITVYPVDDDHAAQIARDVDRVWPSTRGPEVQTDLHLRPGSAVSLRFGLFRSGPSVIGSSGMREFALAMPDGSLAADRQQLSGKQPDCAPRPPVECCFPRALPVKLQEAFVVGNRQYVPLALLRDSPRTKIFLAFSAELMTTVVMKVGMPGVAGDLLGFDIRDRLRKEFQILSELNQYEGLAPRPIDWVEGEWPVLILEDFRGELVSELPLPDRLEALPHLAGSLARLHQAGFVHGDIKLENAVRHGRGIGLIDFELAERAGSIMGGGGTTGYMAPEVKAGCTAEFSRDVFALGASVAEAVLGVPPALLTGGIAGLEGLLWNEGADAAAKLVVQLADADPARRPGAAEAANALAQLPSIEPGTGSPSSASDLIWSCVAAVSAGQLVQRYADGDGWRNEHFMRSFRCEGLNIGAAGIILGLATIDEALGQHNFLEAIDRGARWLAERPVEENPAGLFTGNAGVALGLAVAGNRTGNRNYLAASRRRMEYALADDRETDIFSGRAGVLFASYLLGDMGKHECRLDPRSEPYLGCAHGAAGIAMALACCGRTDEAIAAFQDIYRTGRTDNGTALRMRRDSDRAHAAGNWCHGVAGYLWSILQGVGDHPDLREEIDWAVHILRHSMAAATPTYCHGLAGRLETWRMIAAIPRHRETALLQAGKTARALRVLQQELDGKTSWCSDDPQITTPDLWVGFLGPAAALAMHAAGVNSALLSAEWLGTLTTNSSIKALPRRRNGSHK
jgi:Lanthionine synthetase C-like protein/Protein kinase domain